MTTELTEPQIPAVPKKKNVFERIAGVLFAPAETFEDIARKPDIIAPLLVLLLLGYASTLLIMPRFDADAMFEAQSAQMRKQNPQISDADLERVRSFSTAAAKMFAYASPVLFVILYVVMAAVLLGAFRMMGGEGTFAQAFSTTLYSWIPLTLLSIITTIVVLARGSFDPTTAATLVKSNPAFLTNMSDHPILFSLLSSIDVFTIWTVILLIVGFSVVSKMSRGKSAAIVIALWVVAIVFKLIPPALAAMRS
jgi:hypothetical protein